MNFQSERTGTSPLLLTCQGRAYLVKVGSACPTDTFSHRSPGATLPPFRYPGGNNAQFDLPAPSIFGKSAPAKGLSANVRHAILQRNPYSCGFIPPESAIRPIPRSYRSKRRGLSTSAPTRRAFSSPPRGEGEGGLRTLPPWAAPHPPIARPTPTTKGPVRLPPCWSRTGPYLTAPYH